MLGGLRILVVDVKDSILTFLHVLDANTGFAIFQVSKVVPLAVPTGLSFKTMENVILSISDN